MKKIIVVGNGMVGYKFCEKLRSGRETSQVSITVYGEEHLPAYDRVHLSEYFTNQSADSLLMATKQWYKAQDIELVTGTMVTDIDRENRKIRTHKGTEDDYDILILATGSMPFVPEIVGVDKKGVFVYRTIEDLESIIHFGQNVGVAAVLGGGLLGLEAAKASMDMGLETHVVEFAPRLMPRQLDTSGASILQEQLENLGLHIHLNKATKEITGNGTLDALKFTDGSELKTDMLIISCGIRPRDELAKKCGLKTGERGGIIVNDLLQTSDPQIFAIGEAALHNNMVYGLVAPGYEMADVVVSQITGEKPKTFTGYDMSAKLKLIGIEVASFGDAHGESSAHKPIIWEDKLTGVYKRINISENGNQLLGGMLVGDTRDYNQLLQLSKNNIPILANAEDLIIGRKGSDQTSGDLSLPDSAQICSCEDVSKLDIIEAIRSKNLENLDQLKAETKACTGCGACTPIVKDIMNDCHKTMGKEVRSILCEHFNYTRQELLDIIKVKGIRLYETLLNECGVGDGCEICKPAVASLLASLWNEPITGQDTIQDTNDRFLANIQKGGSYSVVPRIPGGEITPDKLIVIGNVAKKYGLYTKITGGQRIDLFGARVDQLPDIWEELINAGFESGHAYGKALRTVKSCVGSSWCRYGLHDSVSFAIRVEERYRGLRAPHKLKSAVSGCRRECAEAQSKDFGIIATEAGWNLYVCGNGGANPQHAVLLAGDIDEETCIKYIDRFLMFYIKTAEPLNRTATWLNKLSGGINYLREVIVEDSLGLAAELEKEMQFMVDTYKCEWKEVVNNPALRARFKHFLNSPKEDPNLNYDMVRGQKVPVSWD